MAKRKPLKRKRNPDTPTKKENLVSYILAGTRDIFETGQNAEIREGLLRAREEDLNHLLKLTDNLDKWIYWTAGKVRIQYGR